MSTSYLQHWGAAAAKHRCPPRHIVTSCASCACETPDLKQAMIGGKLVWLCVDCRQWTDHIMPRDQEHECRRECKRCGEDLQRQERGRYPKYCPPCGQVMRSGAGVVERAAARQLWLHEVQRVCLGCGCAIEAHRNGNAMYCDYCKPKSYISRTAGMEAM